MTYRDADDAMATIDRDTREAIERARAASAFRQEVDAMRGTGGSGGIHATVDPTGALIGLELPRTIHQDGDSLAQDILRAVREAHAAVSLRVQEAAATTFGADSPVVDRMRAELTKRSHALDSGGGDSVRR